MLPSSSSRQLCARAACTFWLTRLTWYLGLEKAVKKVKNSQVNSARKVQDITKRTWLLSEEKQYTEWGIMKIIYTYFLNILVNAKERNRGT